MTFYAVAVNAGCATTEQVHRLVPSTSLGQIDNVAGELGRSSSRWVTQRKKGYVVAPRNCGSTRAALAAILEPIGAVCLECRHGKAGLYWPAEPYNGYLAHRDGGLCAQLVTPRQCRTRMDQVRTIHDGAPRGVHAGREPAQTPNVPPRPPQEIELGPTISSGPHQARHPSESVRLAL